MRRRSYWLVQPSTADDHDATLTFERTVASHAIELCIDDVQTIPNWVYHFSDRGETFRSLGTKASLYGRYADWTIKQDRLAITVGCWFAPARSR